MKLKHSRMAAAVSHALGAGLICALGTQGALAQQSPVERVTVTGSNIKRVDAETALPVQVISREDIQRSGVTTASDLLDRVSAGVTGYAAAQAMGDSGQPGFSGIQLRGLGVESTLILLNGRRLPNYAFNGGAVDLSSIPFAAIERVEILKDGASAIYGTDAIGGVINFITRTDYSGGELSVYSSQPRGSVGDTKKATLSGGKGNLQTDRYNVFFTADFETMAAIPGSSRSFAMTGIRPDLGIGKTSGNTFPANIRGTGLPGTVNTSAATGCLPSMGSYQVAPNGSASPTRANCRQDYSSVLDISQPTERKSLYAQGAFALNADHQLFGEASYTNTMMRFASSETPVADFSGRGPFLYPQFVNGVATPFYPGPFRLPNGTTVTPSGDLTLQGWRAKPAGRRTDESDATMSRYIGGAKGLVSGWDYNTALSYSESKVIDAYVDGWMRESLLRPAIATGKINLWGPQTAAGQALLDSTKILQPVRNASFKLYGWDGKMSKDIARTQNGAVPLALGAELRRESMKDVPAAVMSSGDIQGGGGAQPPVDAKRDIFALFAETNIPLAKGLEMQLALRHDRYSDSGSVLDPATNTTTNPSSSFSTTNPKVALRFQPSQTMLFRTSYNTGFRAPTLKDKFQARFLSNTPGNWNDPIRCPRGNAVGAFVEGVVPECDFQAQYSSGGNPNLKPEKSNQFTLGTLLEPIKGLSVGLDYWNIEKKDAISYWYDADIFSNYAAFNALGAVHRYPVDNTAGYPGPINYVDGYQVNKGKIRTDGIDVALGYVFPRTDIGTFRVNLDGTWINAYKYQPIVDGPFINNTGNYLDGKAMPRWRHTFTMRYNHQAWSAALTNIYVQKYLDYGSVNPGDPNWYALSASPILAPRSVEAYSIWDFQLGWTGIKNIQMVGGIRNLFDKDPPASRQQETFQVGFDPKYADVRGRTAYVRLSMKF